MVSFVSGRTWHTGAIINNAINVMGTTNKDDSRKDPSSTIPSNTYNVFRDSPLRYLGYANEIGESFRYQVRTSYIFRQNFKLQTK